MTPKSVDPWSNVISDPSSEGGKVYLPPYPPSSWTCFSDIAKNMHRRERIAKVSVSLAPQRVFTKSVWDPFGTSEWLACGPPHDSRWKIKEFLRKIKEFPRKIKEFLRKIKEFLKKIKEFLRKIKRMPKENQRIHKENQRIPEENPSTFRSDV